MGYGTVTLIGAGPGDPGLITVKGAEALKAADVVVYDRLAHPSLLPLYAREDAELVYVGKKADHHAMVQEDINALLADRAIAGKTVARLKGGDPFVFGRGGEEAEYLEERGIPWVVVPGVTSAISAPAYAGIPVTHRDASSSFAVITGHERSDGKESGGREAGAAEQRRRWDKIAHAADTLIFLMGVENLTEIVAQLLANGRDAATPVALVRWGTWAGKQQALTGTLETIVQQVREAKFKAPAVTVVGDVVLLRERLRWFDKGSLSGKRIVVTRAREQASEFVDLLRRQNAEPIEFPLIKIAAPSDGYGIVDEKLDTLSRYGWVLFASAPAVIHFFNRLKESGRDTRALASLKIGAVGPATAEALRTKGINPDYVSKGGTGADLGKELPGQVAGVRILIPGALETDPGLETELTDRWANVEPVVVYQNVLDGSGADLVKERLEEGSIDAITFTSSSTVKNFVAALDGAKIPDSVVVAAIGPSTAETAEKLLGRKPDIVAEVHTIAGLLASLTTYYSAL
jgi:uroporphyrinogen III methyltransferase/synthase